MLRSGTVGPLDPDTCDLLLAPLRDAAGVLLAVSGGPDSIALLRLAAAWRLRIDGPHLAVATVDHGLRAEARAEAKFVAAAATRLELPHAILEWRGPKPSSRLQERARTARYDLLTAHARDIGASHLATAHTLDDQAETILFRMARGSGPTGLIGMRPWVRRGGIVHVRPLLGVRKARLVATCRAQAWPYFEDVFNRDPRFARTRWRAIVSRLADEGLTPERFDLLSKRLARADAALIARAQAVRCEALLDGDHSRLAFDGRRLASEPMEVLLRVLAGALDGLDGAERKPRLRLERLESFCDELARALASRTRFRRTLAGALVWTRSDGTLVVAREPARSRAAPGARRSDAAG